MDAIGVDIVERLRRSAANVHLIARDYAQHSRVGAGRLTTAADVMGEAAREIERLRVKGE